MNNEQLMKLDGLVYLREITSGKFENVSKFIDYITTDENGNISPEELPDLTSIKSKGVLFSYGTPKLFLNPRLCRGFSLYNKIGIADILISTMPIFFLGLKIPKSPQNGEL